MKHILGSCVLAGLFLFCACDDTLDTKVTWQIGDSDTWNLLKAYYIKLIMA